MKIYSVGLTARELNLLAEEFSQVYCSLPDHWKRGGTSKFIVVHPCATTLFNRVRNSYLDTPVNVVILHTYPNLHLMTFELMIAYFDSLIYEDPLVHDVVNEVCTGLLNRQDSSAINALATILALWLTDGQAGFIEEYIIKVCKRIDQRLRVCVGEYTHGLMVQ